MGTAFSAFKAGMTHITRDVHRIDSRLHKREVVEAVTIIETPPMRVVGFVGYIETVKGLRALSTVDFVLVQRGQEKNVQELVQVQEEGLHQIRRQEGRPRSQRE